MYYFRDFKFQTSGDAYEPEEDSVLLAESLIINPRAMPSELRGQSPRIKSGDYVLDIGTGIGIQAIVAARTAEKVLATDINPNAIEIARSNAELNKIRNIEFRISNLFEKVNEKFDLIIFNPPYLPSHEEDMLSASWAGGKNGVEVINKFLQSVANYLKPGGKFEILISSLNDPENIKKKFNENNLGFEIIARKKLWFEEIYVILGNNII